MQGNSEKIWKIWKKPKLNRDKIWKRWKKDKLNSERTSSQKIIRLQDANNEN